MAEQLSRLVSIALVVERADRVDHPACRQFPGTGDAHLSGRAPPTAIIGGQEQTLFLQGRPGCAVNGPINATASGELRIRSVDDGVDCLLDDVPEDQFDATVLSLEVVRHVLQMPNA
jgi:hypothetical protein